MQKELLKVALIGVGSVGKKYARMITAGEVPHMKLSAVVIRRDELIAVSYTHLDVYKRQEYAKI